MTHIVGIINGKAPSGGSGGVTDKDFSNLAVNFFSKGVAKPDDYKLEQQSTPNMTVKVNIGKAYVPNSTSSMLYQTELDASVNATIGANASGNPRIDAIAIKVDLGVTPNSIGSNVVSIVVVAGTPAASPSAPNDAAIQAAVGAGNPFYRLGNVTVANGAASITDANIASTREGVILRVVGGYIRYNLGLSRLEFSNNGSNWVPAGTSVPARCRVRRTSNQSIPNNTFTVVAFDAEDFDNDVMHDPVTNNSRITIKTAGVYLFIATVAWVSNATGNRQALFKLNGADVTGTGPKAYASTPGVSGTPGDTISAIAPLAVNDYVELAVFQDSGGALSVEGGDGYYKVSMSAIYIGAAS